MGLTLGSLIYRLQNPIILLFLCCFFLKFGIFSTHESSYLLSLRLMKVFSYQTYMLSRAWSLRLVNPVTWEVERNTI
jgi:hypothetical protein